MTALAALVTSLGLGVAAGRYAGWRGRLLLPLIVVGVVVVSFATGDFVEPFVAVLTLVWLVLASVGLVVGPGLHRRAGSAV